MLMKPGNMIEALIYTINTRGCRDKQNLTACEVINWQKINTSCLMINLNVINAVFHTKCIECVFEDVYM